MEGRRPRRLSRPRVFAALVACAGVGPFIAAQDSLPAFPGAVGFGAVSVGGRGGDVYHVTSLLDDGSPGTLRHGVETATGPRTIVFDVGGTIELGSVLTITADAMTIAGQTAPGGGITVAKYPTAIAESTDIVVRYMRFRTGDFNAQFPGEDGGVGTPGVGNGNGDLIGNNADALRVGVESDRVMIDHVSTSWSMDETLSVTRARNVTVQHSIISESLNDSFHDGGPHGLGSLVRGEVTPEDQANETGGYTFYGNLYAHHTARNPGAGPQQTLDPGQTEEERRSIDLDFVNNVIYDWGFRASHTLGAKGRINYVGNYLIAGSSTAADQTNVALRANAAFEVFVSGVMIDSDQDGENDPLVAGSGAFVATLVPQPFAAPPVDALAADVAYQRALVQVGASRVRDAIDARVVDQVMARTGGVIDSQSQVGGLVPIAGGPAPLDSDGDGMPDAFELANGLSTSDPEDRNGTSLSPDGYTNLEIYLNSIVDTGEFEPLAASFSFALIGENEAQFNATASTTQEGHSIISYAWDFGDGMSGSDVVSNHVYDGPGLYTVKLEVTDDRGLISAVQEELMVPLTAGDVSPWTAVDIGSPVFPSGARFDGDCLLVSAGGRGITGVNDELHFLYQPVRGSFRLTAEVSEVSSQVSGARIGLMLRESLERNSRNAGVFVTAADPPTVVFSARRSSATSTVAVDSEHRWIRLERVGDELIGSSSADAVTWTEIGRRTVVMPVEILGGVAATGSDRFDEGQSLFGSVCSITTEPIPVTFVRGDCNGDGEVAGNVSDAVFLLLFNFGVGVEPGCLAACDANGDGEVTGSVTDAVFLLEHSFLLGPSPPAPYPSCGPRVGELECLLPTPGCGIAE